MTDAMTRNPDLPTSAQLQRQDSQRLSSLGRIERHIFFALVAGRSVEHVAVDLGLSDLLAESYRAQMMRKLNVCSLIDLLVISEFADKSLALAA